MDKVKMQRILDRIISLEEEVENMYYTESGENGEIQNDTVTGLDTLKDNIRDARSTIKEYRLV